MQQQQPFAPYGGHQQPFWSFGGQQQPLPPFGGWQSGRILGSISSNNSVLGGPGDFHGSGAPRGRGRGRGGDRGIGRGGRGGDRGGRGGRGGSRGGNPSQRVPLAIESPKKTKTRDERKEKKSAVRLANRAKGEANLNEAQYQQALTLLGVSTEHPVAKDAIRRLDVPGLAETSSLSVKDLMEDLRIRPAGLNINDASQRMEVDDMAWALSTLASDQVQQNLIARSQSTNISIIELGMLDHLFFDEIENRHAIVEDEKGEKQAVVEDEEGAEEIAQLGSELQIEDNNIDVDGILDENMGDE